MRRPNPTLLRLVVFVAALISVVLVLIFFRKIFLPLLLGLGVAYLFDPAVSWFERRGRSRLFGVVAITLLLVVGLVVLLIFIVPAIGDQLERLADRLPVYNKKLKEAIQPLFDRLEARYPEELAELQERAVTSLRENLPRVAGVVGRLSGRLFSNLFEFLLFLLNLVFVPVFAFYLLVDLPHLKRSLTGLLPVPYRDVILDRVREVDGAVASFLRGQLTIALVLAFINAVGLVILDVPFGLGLGIIAGLANMIPYMALVVGLVPALFLCWAEHPQAWLRLLGVVAVFGGAQLLEGTVLSPRILSRSVNLHPVWVLLAIIAGGSLFGFIGMVIAVPVAAAIQVFSRHWLELYRRSSIYDPSLSREVRPDADPPPAD